MGIGAEIARARQAAGFSHADLAARTRIRSAIIEAIEREDFDACGGEVYVRGHLRAIARALAVDPSPWLDAVGGADSATTLAQEEPAHLNIWDLRNRAKSGSERRAWLPLVLAALVIVSAFIYFARANSATQELLPAETVSPSASATPTETAAPTATTTPAKSAMPSATATPEQVIEQPVTGAVQFTLTCVSASWVRITNALGTIYEGTMQPGETRDVVSDSEVFVRVGNAAGMQLEYNGRFFPTLGNPGEVYSHTFRVL